MPVIPAASSPISKAVAGSFPKEGTGLARFASLLKGVEVDTAVYGHRRAWTSARWADRVLNDFQFALRKPQTIIRDRRLTDIGPLFLLFLKENVSARRRDRPVSLPSAAKAGVRSDCHRSRIHEPAAEARRTHRDRGAPQKLDVQGRLSSSSRITGSTACRPPRRRCGRRPPSQRRPSMSACVACRKPTIPATTKPRSADTGKCLPTMAGACSIPQRRAPQSQTR